MSLSGATEFNSFGGVAKGYAIDDVRIYTRALSQESVAQLAGGGTPAAPDTGGSSRFVEIPVLGDPVRNFGPPDELRRPGASSTSSTGTPGVIPSDFLSTPTELDSRYASDEERLAAEAAQRDASGPVTRDQALAGADDGAGGQPYTVGEPWYSPVLGTRGGIRNTADLIEQFVTSIHWDEVKNRPCELAVVGYDQRAGSGVASFAPIGECGAGLFEMLPVPRLRGVEGAREFKQSVSLVEGWTIDTERDLAVTSLRVCTNKGNSRLKGMRISASTVNADGTITYSPAGDEEVLVNCSNSEWSGYAICPNDRVATGVVVHGKEWRGNKGVITGLQLICRTVSLR